MQFASSSCRVRFILQCLAVSLLAPAVLLGQQPYRIGPSGAWISPIQPDLARPAPTENLSDGYELLLVDQQELVSPRERYVHVAYRLLTDGAVEDRSQISVEFRPAYQRITLNGVTVTRNGQVVNQLKPAQIHVARREADLDSHMLEDAKVITVILEDVKPGDVVEYSYTRAGANPVFAGHYTATVVPQTSVPMRRFHYRILTPRGRVLFHRASESMRGPTVTDRGDMREYVWSASDVPARLLDADLPDWYDPLPTVRLTDYPTWRAVAAWADSLFVVPTRLPAKLAARVEHIRTTERSPEAQVVAALRFVQDSIRYVGLEIGMNSHRPFAPATVLERGYGDCKDKTLLLVTMLRALGLDAHPALVSTTYREHVRAFQPTSAAFDHAITGVEVGGKTHWIDPTALYQRGALEAVGATYGAALMVTPTTDSLTAIPRPLADPLTEISVRFELAAVGKPVSMRVQTLYRGADADRERAWLRSKSVSELSKQFADYYARTYPGITVAAAPTFEDDEIGNFVRTDEHYTIPAFWQKSRNGRGHLGTLEPREMNDVIPSVASATRSMPLRIGYPVHYRYNIDAHLEEGWNIPAEGDTIVTPGVRFTRSLAVEEKLLTLRYEYETLADHVSPSLSSAHFEKLAAIHDQLAFSITPPSTDPAATGGFNLSEVNASIALLAALTLALATFGAYRLRRSPAPGWLPNATEPDAALAGLGGWLALMGLAVCVRPLVFVRAIASSAPLYTATFWANHTAPDGVSYHPLWAPTLIYELVANLTLLVFTVLLIVEFFGRRRWFPPLFIMVVTAMIVFNLGDAIIARGIPAVQAKGFDWQTQTRTLMAGLVWSVYLVKSQRVRSTFVN